MSEVKPKVLLVEDEEMVASSLIRLLKARFEPLWARNETEALSLFETAEGSIRAIVLDGNLGDHDSIEVIKILRGRFRGPMIAVSFDGDMRARQMEAGCSGQCDKTEVVDELTKLFP